MQPQFVFNIHDLQQLGMRDVEATLSREWMAHALDGTEVAPSASREGELTLRLVASGRDVVVRGTIVAPVDTQCGRCLAPITLDIRTELSLFLVPGAAKPGAPKKPAGASPSPSSRAASAKRGESASNKAGSAKTASPKAGKGKWHKEGGQDIYEFDADEADADTYQGDEFVLDEFIREAILLEVPIFPLCSEECPGIRPVPAAAAEAPRADPPIDPRLAPLLALKKKS